ncbi:MAG: hypothetical protein U0744_03890 [Gemmataceae bacterium]
MAKPLNLEWRKDQVPQELIDLKSNIEQLPLPLRDKMMPLVDRLGHYTRLQGRLVRIAQDAVDQLQLDIKYLLFDLDATRRERDDLAGRIEETGIEGGESEGELE